jgi:M61 glycyl aminopeptidase
MNHIWQDLRYGARMLLKKTGLLPLALIAIASSLSLVLILSCDAQPQGHNAQPFKIERFTVSNVEVSLHYFDQRLLPLDARIKAVVGQGFTEAVKLFGGLPKDLSGADYRRFQVNLRYGPGEAESDPQLIEIEMNEELERKPVFGYITWQLALIHELLHFWNAETFRYRSGREQWFNEGVTEYYAFKLAIKLGLIGHSEIPARLGLPVGYYLNDSGIGVLSMSEAGVGEEKFEHYFLVYGGGLTAALVLDYDLRRRTNNDKSLDDLMRAMYHG